MDRHLMELHPRVLAGVRRGSHIRDLTRVYHKSIVSVDESSDDIITGGGASASSTLPPRLTVNRPFIFIIYQQMSGVLSMGRVIDPWTGLTGNKTSQGNVSTWSYLKDTG
ncbi:Protein Z-dependent protease inhibitor [Liparis tanakae]|uniref:Protein Z-dependent protease inhibitor n=1 Tax=Liparis tanakae TaxID=230148 RepID=A0A4Z2FVA0_9TELE|nr:Protein Z-dependent protease inhibitor [Liparis tanakae]